MAVSEVDRRLILNHQAMLAQIRERVRRYALARFGALSSYRDADMERFVAMIVPVIEAGQKQVSALTNAHMDALARAAGITPSAAVRLQYDLRNGVNTAEVYARPFQTVWWRLSEGDGLGSAVEAATQRLWAILATDMQLAQSMTAFAKISGDKRVVGWQRVLGEAESCPLCAIASTQRYHRGDLQPIHDHCRCSVEPIYGDTNPGQVINEERLASVQDQLKEQGYEYTAGGFKTDRTIRVQNHGEIGPVLTWADHNFTGPLDF